MLSFWAGGISSFSSCAREYRLLRRLKYYESYNPKYHGIYEPKYHENYDPKYHRNYETFWLTTYGSTLRAIKYYEQFLFTTQEIYLRSRVIFDIDNPS